MAANNDNDDSQCIEDSISDTDDTRSIKSTISDTESIDSVTLLKRNRVLWKAVAELRGAFQACKDTMEKLIEKPIELLSKQTHVDLRAGKALLKESEKTLVENVLLLKEGVGTMRKAMNVQSNKFNEFMFNGEFSNDCSFDSEDSQILQKDYPDNFEGLDEVEDHMMSNISDSSADNTKINSLRLEKHLLRKENRRLQDCISQQEIFLAERYGEKCLHDMRQNLFTAKRPFVMKADCISQEERIYAKKFVDKYVFVMKQVLYGDYRPFTETGNTFHQEKFYAKIYLEKYVHVMKKKLCVAYGHLDGEAIMEDLGILAVYLQVNAVFGHGHGIKLQSFKA